MHKLFVATNIHPGVIVLSFAFGFFSLILATHFGVSFKKALIIAAIVAIIVFVSVLYII
jgi:hypothetical protein